LIKLINLKKKKDQESRARVKLEHLIREDYMIEAMEIVEMYCDLLLARFGLLQAQKELDPGLEECVASLIWVSPRMQTECAELKIVTNELKHKYGKEFTNACLKNDINKVNDKLMRKMNEQAPSELFIEKYLFEIAQSHNINFKPDPSKFLENLEKKKSVSIVKLCYFVFFRVIG
jgi:vacuolar protein sorting-associated protein IST1